MHVHPPERHHQVDGCLIAMGWASRRSRLQTAVHRQFELEGLYIVDDTYLPVKLNMRRLPAVVGDAETAIEIPDEIIEVDFLTLEVAAPQTGAQVQIDEDMYRIARTLRRNATVVTVEVA
jgi:hypothetical protein